MKHPSAIAENALKSYELALQSDPISAFGGIVSFKGEVDEKLANEIVKTFYEVIIAKSFSKKSLEIFEKKKNLRLISLENINEQDNLSYTFLGDNFLLQDKDQIEINKKELKFVTKNKPTDKEFVGNFRWDTRTVVSISENFGQKFYKISDGREYIRSDIVKI